MYNKKHTHSFLKKASRFMEHLFVKALLPFLAEVIRGVMLFVLMAIVITGAFGFLGMICEIFNFFPNEKFILDKGAIMAANILVVFLICMFLYGTIHCMKGFLSKIKQMWKEIGEE